MEHHGFPSDETLAAFLDGVLDAPTRKRVVAHIATCDECYAIVVGAAESSDLPVAPVRRRGRPSRRFLLVAAICVVAIAAILTPALWQRVHSDPLAELAAHIEHRHIEPRIAGFGYRPYEPPLRDATANDLGRDPDNWAALYRPAADIGQRAKRDPSPQNLDALAAAHLVLGDYDEAVAAIQRALQAETQERDLTKALAKSRDATLLSDAAAVYLARAKARDVPRDNYAAAEAAERAWRLAQRPEIAWNRALACESLHQRETALAAWNDFLRLDATSPWAAEARQHIAKLQRPTSAQEWSRERPRLAALAGAPAMLDDVVARFPQQARIYVEELLLPEWGRAEAAGDAPRADAALRTARAVSASVRRFRGSALDDDAIRAIDASHGDARLALARGHAAYGAARALFDAESFQSASESFRAASSALAASPFVITSRIWEIACIFMRDDFATTSREAAALEAQMPDAYSPQRGRICWLRALAELELAHPDTAIELYQKAAANFAAVDEQESVAMVKGLLADVLQTVGEHDAAMPLRIEALAEIERTGAPAERFRAEASSAAMTMGYRAAARVLLAPMLAPDAKPRGSFWRCTALAWNSALLDADGDRAGALRDMQRAKLACAAIADAGIRNRVVANMTLSDLAAAPGGDTILWLESALDFFRRSDNRLCVAELLDRRGRLRAARHERARAEADYRESVAVLETARGDMGDGEQRDAFVAGASRVYGDLIDLLLDESRYVEALEIADRSRSGALVGPRHAHGQKSARPHSDWLRAKLPADVVIIEYALRGDSLVTWLMSSEQISAMRATVDATQLAALVSRAAKTQQPSDLGDLYQLLVRPWSKNVPARRTIIFVPDPALETVPFSALFDREQQRYLVEDYAVGVAPSALSFVASAMEYRARGNGDRALLVADPSVNRRQYPNLERLDGARGEVMALRPLYTDARPLVGDAATRASFLRELASANVVHFAGHALVNEAVPRYSALLVAGDEANLYMPDLPSSALAHVRLAVLSACSTARGSHENRGTATLARAFLGRGVPAVVGTLWPLPDDAGELFSRSFHRALRDGSMPAAALREAQLAMLRSSDARLRRPSSWGAFRLIGAATMLKEDSECRLCGSSTQESAR
jgi:CHAT domain-containing protein